MYLYELFKIKVLKVIKFKYQNALTLMIING